MRLLFFRFCLVSLKKTPPLKTQVRIDYKIPAVASFKHTRKTYSVKGQVKL